MEARRPREGELSKKERDKYRSKRSIIKRGGGTERVKAAGFEYPHPCVPRLTGEVVELGQRLHDDEDERQVELSDVRPDLGVGVAGVGVMAAQQGVDGADGFLVEEEDPGRWRTGLHLLRMPIYACLGLPPAACIDGSGRWEPEVSHVASRGRHLSNTAGTKLSQVPLFMRVI